MGRYRSRSRSRSYSPVRRKHYDDPRDYRRRQRRSSPSAPSGLLVRNISMSARPEDLRIPFERFGPIKDIYLPKNYYTGEPRGFGFVKFQFPEDASKAKAQLNRTVIGGREIRIVFAEENRKTPQEMRRLTRVSNQSSYRRRSASRSPRRQYRSYSLSPSSPAGHDSSYHGARDAYYSSYRSRSVSRSISPREERTYKSHDRPPRHRSISRSLSPQSEKHVKLRHHYKDYVHSPEESGKRVHYKDYDRANDEGYLRSNAPGRKSGSLSRSRSRSYSPR